MFLAVIARRLDAAASGRRCRGVVSPAEGVCELLFPGFGISLASLPGGPGVAITEGTGTATLQPWHDILAGSVLESAGQAGLDRILVLAFGKARAYRDASTVLHFEMTGRNTNLVLVRAGDSRILACTRRVTGRMSRRRTLAPGEVYSPPPPSGLPPSQWAGASAAAALDAAVSPADIYGMLEGVGPLTASAILGECAATGLRPGAVAASLAASLLDGRFEPWTGPWGPMPVRLGPGEPMDDPFDVFRDPVGGAARSPAAGAWLRSVRERVRAASRALERVESLVRDLPGPEELRLRAGLLLARAADVPPGCDRIVLEDWEGVPHEIPLRPGRTVPENADRLFRKARRAEEERRRLEERAGSLRRSVADLEEEAGRVERTGIIPASTPPDRPGGRRTGARKPVDLGGGWVCWVGRNARDNDELTFGIARRGDFWLHERGGAGPHVILRGDTASGNPPSSVMVEAARLAAGRGRGMAAVDWTRVQLVRRIRGGRPGEVSYTGERTIFIDRDGPPSRGIGPGRADPVEE